VASHTAGWTAALLRSWPIILFIVVAAVIAGADWGVIAGSHVETGDFAANSLLVLDAKEMRLLTGNYSRVGFNHPGPAILYVLAAGERIFFDALHVVQSPIAGQMIAAILYNSFWIVLLARLFARTFATWQQTAIATSVFLIATALFDHDFFAGMWFPHLYYFPFAVMVVSIARLACGTADSLHTLALSSGFLLNGHVAFVAVLSIMLIGAIVTNVLLVRRDRRRSLIDAAFYKSNRRTIVLAVVIFSAFLVPLLIATAVHFPGPIGDYASFGDGHRQNTPREALTFLSVYWGGRVALLIAALLLIVIWRVARSAFGRDVDIKALIAMMSVATIAMFAYAKYGVDLLEYRYLGLFYYAIPGLALSIAVVTIFGRGGRWVAGFIMVTGLGMTVAAAKTTPYYQNVYDDPQIVGLEKGMEDLRTDGRLVLELDDGRDWGSVWSTVVGMELQAKRRHRDLFCIDRNWHISDTKQARCTVAELAEHRRLLVTAADAQVMPEREPLLKGTRVAFYDWTPAPVPSNAYVGMRNDAVAFRDTVLASGWTPVDELVWTETKEARLTIPLNADLKGTLVLDTSAFLPRADSRQDVKILAGDREVAAATFTRSHDRQPIRIPFAVSSAGYLELKVLVAHPLSEKELRVSNDPRRLGIALHGFTLVSGS
jgi:hypothetical protein